MAKTEVREIETEEKKSSKLNEIEAKSELNTILNWSGTEDSDTVYSYGGNTLDGKGGNDHIFAGAGNDTLYGGEGNDFLSGGTGKDTLKGGDDNDFIDGGSEDDKLYGGCNNDTALGGTGDDTVKGESGEDYLYGGEGTDSLLGGFGNDTLLGGAGQDTLDGGYGNDLLNGGLDNDTINGGADNDTILGGEGDDKIDGGTGNDSILGGAGKDTIEGLNGDDFIDGGLDDDTITDTYGKDTIYGGAGNDSINAGAYNDTVYGGEGNDIILGGLNDDELHGGSGENTFMFGKNGDTVYSTGNDTIYAEDGTDIIDLSHVAKGTWSAGTGTGNGRGKFEDFKVEKVGDDLVFNYDDGSITIKDYFKDGYNKDVKFKFGENGIYDIKDSVYTELDGDDAVDGTITGTFLSDHITGTEGNDVIKAGLGDDEINAGEGNDKIYSDGGSNTYTFKAGDGKDSIYSTTGNDTVAFDGEIKSDGITVKKKGNDVIIEYNDGKDSVTLKDFFKNGTSVQNFKFGDKSQTLNDFLKAHEDVFGDLHQFNEKLPDDKNNSFKGSVLSDTIVGGNQKDTVKAGGGNDSVDGGLGNDKLYGEYGEDTLLGGSGVDLVKGGEGNDSIDGGDGEDKLYGEANDDTIKGGAGNDKLYGGAGINTYVFDNASGHDMLYVDKKSSGEILDFAGVKAGDEKTTAIKFEDLKYSVKGNDLIITYNEAGDSVTLSGYLKSPEKKPNVQFKFAEGDIYDKSLAELLTEGLINIDFVGVHNKKNSIKGTKYNDHIVGENLNDTLKGNDGNDTIYGGDGNDKLYGDNGNDKIDGGAGDDKLYGGSSVVTEGRGGNAFFFDKGSGNDTLYYTKPGKGLSATDYLVAKDEVMEDAKFSRHKNDLIVEYGDNDSLTIKDYFKHADWNLYYHALKDDKTFEGYDPNITDSDLLSEHFVRGSKVSKNDGFKNRLTGKTLSGLVYESKNNMDTFFLSNGTNDWLKGGTGDDYYRSTSKYALAEDKGGDDQYFADNFTKGIFEINDAVGEDDLIIDEKSDDIHVFFDVNDGLMQRGMGDLYLFGDKVFDTFSKGKGNENNFKGVIVDDYFYSSWNGSMENIESSDGYTLSEESLKNIVDQVHSWLNGHDEYSSAMDVLENGSKEDINELLSIYDEYAKWEKPQA